MNYYDKARDIDRRAMEFSNELLELWPEGADNAALLEAVFQLQPDWDQDEDSRKEAILIINKITLGLENGRSTYGKFYEHFSEGGTTRELLEDALNHLSSEDEKLGQLYEVRGQLMEFLKEEDHPLLRQEYNHLSYEEKVTHIAGMMDKTNRANAETILSKMRKGNAQGAVNAHSDRSIEDKILAYAIGYYVATRHEDPLNFGYDKEARALGIGKYAGAAERAAKDLEKAAMAHVSGDDSVVPEIIGTILGAVAGCIAMGTLTMAVSAATEGISIATNFGLTMMVGAQILGTFLSLLAAGVVFLVVLSATAFIARKIMSMFSDNDNKVPDNSAPEKDEGRRYSAGLLVVKSSDGKWGFIDETGRVVIPCQWDDVREFSEGLAAVKSGDKWGYINQSGKLVIPCIWDAVENFSLGEAKVWRKPLYIKVDGSKRIPINAEIRKSLIEAGLLDEYAYQTCVIDRAGRIIRTDDKEDEYDDKDESNIEDDESNDDVYV